MSRAFLISLLLTPGAGFIGHVFVPSKASLGVGFSLLPKFWAEMRALLFLWGAEGAVISSLERISHQGDRDRSWGGGAGDGLYVNESSSRQPGAELDSCSPGEVVKRELPGGRSG